MNLQAGRLIVVPVSDGVLHDYVVDRPDVQQVAPTGV